GPDGQMQTAHRGVAAALEPAPDRERPEKRQMRAVGAEFTQVSEPGADAADGLQVGAVADEPPLPLALATGLGPVSRPEARCRDCSRSVSSGRSPNPPCGS